MIPQYMYTDLKSKAIRRLGNAKNKVRAKYEKELRQLAEQVFAQCDKNKLYDISLGHGGITPSISTQINYTKVNELKAKMAAVQKPVFDKLHEETAPLDLLYEEWELALINTARTDTDKITLPDF